MGWFTGIVEDIDDPLKIGRVRVRIHGLHSDAKTQAIEIGEGIPTDTLPWALPMQPIISAGNDGMGWSPVGMIIGTQVVGFSRDTLYNDLIIMGVIAGAPGGVSDIPMMAQGKETSIVDNKKSSVTKNVSTADGSTWSEPETPFAPVYPNNQVIQTVNGIVIEVDDTPSNERVHIYHPSGTFQEIHPDGTVVSKCVNESYEIVHKDKNISITGSININTGSNCNINTGKDCNIKTTGNTNINTAECIINASKNITANAQSISITAKGSTNIAATGSVTLSSSSSVSIIAAATASLVASGSVSIIGSSITLKGSRTVVI